MFPFITGIILYVLTQSWLCFSFRVDGILGEGKRANQMKQTKGSFYCGELLLMGAKNFWNYHPDVQEKKVKTTSIKKPSKQAELYKAIFYTDAHLNRIN